MASACAKPCCYDDFGVEIDHPGGLVLSRAITPACGAVLDRNEMSGSVRLGSMVN